MPYNINLYLSDLLHSGWQSSLCEGSGMYKAPVQGETQGRDLKKMPASSLTTFSPTLSSHLAMDHPLHQMHLKGLPLGLLRKSDESVSGEALSAKASRGCCPRGSGPISGQCAVWLPVGRVKSGHPRTQPTHMDRWRAAESLVPTADITPALPIAKAKDFKKLKLQSREKHVIPQSGDAEVISWAKDAREEAKMPHTKKSFLITSEENSGVSLGCEFCSLPGVIQGLSALHPHPALGSC